jgi:hypothetical protein
LEQQVWESVEAFLFDPAKFITEMSRHRGENTGSGDEIKATIKALEGKLDKVVEAETNLALERVRPDNDLSDEAYRRASALLRADVGNQQK